MTTNYNKISQELMDKFGFRLSTKTTIGMREYQEDNIRLKLVPVNGITYLLLVVTDGHGGHVCSDYSSTKFIDCMETLLKAKTKCRVKTMMKIALERTSTSWDQYCFQQDKVRVPRTQKQLSKLFNSVPDLDVYRREGRDSGCTLVAAVIQCEKRVVTTINIGDSRAQWRVGGSIGATVDHVPRADDAPDGCKLPRLVALDEYGQVRVNDELGVGRVIGDNTPSLFGRMRREGDVNSFSFKQDLDLILASDGLWDEMHGQNWFRKVDADPELTFFDRLKPSDNASIVVLHAPRRNNQRKQETSSSSYSDMSRHMGNLSLSGSKRR